MKKSIWTGVAFFASIMLILVGIGLTSDKTVAFRLVGASSACGQMRIASHKTSAMVAPENTVAGIAAVPTQGAGVVEMDVQWSSNGFPVLMHDATVDRTTLGTGKVSALPLASLTKLTAVDYAPWKGNARFASAKVPYGWDFMNAASKANLDVILDIHADPTKDGMSKLVSYIDTFAWRDRTVLMTTPARLTAMRGWQPGLRYGIIEYPPKGRVYTGDYLRGIGATFYAVPITALQEDELTRLATSMHDAGLSLYTWTSDSAAIDSAANWTKAYRSGVDVLITDQPAAALSGCA